MTLKPIFWNNEQTPIYTTLDNVFDDLCNDDMLQGLMNEPCTLDDILDEAESIDELTLDGIVVPFVKLDYKMRQMQMVMKRVSGKLDVVSYQVSQPFTRLGTANIAAIFELSDGQTVSIYFHNPDVTPKKIQPQDDVISFKWLLNKKDVTIVVAPERGREIDVRQVAMRIMKIAEKNSAAFARQNQKRAERAEALDATMKRIEEKQKRLNSLLKEIDTLKYLKAEEETEQLLEQERLDESEMTPTLYRELKEKNLLERRQDELDDLFNRRMVNLRNALRELGWIGEQYKTLTKENYKLKMEFENIGSGANTVGVIYRVEDTDITLEDDLTQSPQEMAEYLDAGLLKLLSFERKNYLNTLRTAMIDKVLAENPVQAEIRKVRGNYRIVDIETGKDIYGEGFKDENKVKYIFERGNASVDTFHRKAVASRIMPQISGLTVEEIQQKISEVKHGTPENNAEVQPKTEPKDEPITVTGNEFGEFDTNTEEGKAELRAKVVDYLKSLKDSGETVFCAALNAEVGFNRESWGKVQRFGGDVKKLYLVTKIKDVIKNGKLVKADKESYVPKEKAQGITYSVLETPVTIQDVKYYARTTIRKLQNGQYQYDLRVNGESELIVDSAENETLWETQLSKADLPQGYSPLISKPVPQLDDGQVASGQPYELTQEQAKSLVTDDITLNLDGAQEKYVLNLFLFDENGNPIPDEDEDDEPTTIDMEKTENQLKNRCLAILDILKYDFKWKDNEKGDFILKVEKHEDYQHYSVKGQALFSQKEDVNIKRIVGITYFVCNQNKGISKEDAVFSITDDLSLSARDIAVKIDQATSTEYEEEPIQKTTQKEQLANEIAEKAKSNCYTVKVSGGDIPIVLARKTINDISVTINATWNYTLSPKRFEFEVIDSGRSGYGSQVVIAEFDTLEEAFTKADEFLAKNAQSTENPSMNEDPKAKAKQLLEDVINGRRDINDETLIDEILEQAEPYEHDPELAPLIDKVADMVVASLPTDI